MYSYYLSLAWRRLRHNLVLTLLMVAAIGVGIGASMTIMTVLRTLSADPIPSKSSQLFEVMIDNWGTRRIGKFSFDERTMVSYRDAHNWLQEHRAQLQTPTYPVRFTVLPAAADVLPFDSDGRAATADFFAMFNVPFSAGHAWNASEDHDAANVVVIGQALADRLFPNGSAVGQIINLDQQDYRIVGVIGDWHPVPRFYAVKDGAFDEPEAVFLPFSTAIERQLDLAGNNSCNAEPQPGWEGHLHSECIWLDYWVQLPTAEAVRDYQQYLRNYAEEMKRSGRFDWDARTAIYSVKTWLVREKVVPDEMRVSALVAGGFLVVCLINTVGLMLARLSSRAAELGVRRALGASKADIFAQCLVESAAIGVAGGLLGLALTQLGLSIERGILDEDIARAAHLDPGAIAMTIALSVFATVCSGLYPSWRASRVQPAWQLKAQ
jgi:putative ABC transport system permease protein